jgi:hypothetical protein
LAKKNCDVAGRLSVFLHVRETEYYFASITAACKANASVTLILFKTEDFIASVAIF